MPDAAQVFIEQSRRYLSDHYLPKIEGCLEKLADEDLWWRPNEASNSVGNLLLHLAGNVRQWIVSGVGGGPDARQRQQEFDERAEIPGPVLLARLKAAVEEADRVLAGLDPTHLLDVCRIQERDVSVLEAVYHVVEHFSTHTGQIAYVAKLRVGVDLGLPRWRDWHR